ncbi:MAG: aminotransferase class I/II-fold pyridoxal phosphate-dependent enzyme [Chloroflexi bacterium]|nr:aminotransferase class I/II-fold pyridoxal phosphate-dependent enzyme [Chloroflexota bacterium]
MNWDSLFADRTRQMRRSTVREILKLTAKPEVISFAGGLPAPELFPIERIREATDTILAERGQEAMQYSTTEGMPELRELIARRLSAGEFQISPNNVLITSGSQQAIDMLARIFLNEGDSVIVENPTYVGMMTSWRPFNLNFLAVPTDNDGMIVDELEPLLQQNPKIIYSIPTFQNPQGTTLNRERRVKLAQLLTQYGIPFVEDNPYGELRYSGDPVPSVLEMEAAARGSTTVDGSVIYTGTFSKVLTPGLRIAWVVAHEAVIDKLVQVKQATDLHTSTFNQFVSYEVARDDEFLIEHVKNLRDVYRQRRDLMMQTMEEYFPQEVTWTRPEGGLFLMVTMPEYLNSREVLKQALAHNVAFVPCDDFFIGDAGRSTFRLNFSNAGPERIVEGIKRLGTVLKESVRQPNQA